MTNYTLYGAQPATIVRANDGNELSAAIRQAYNEGAAIIPWGSGTRQHIGAAPTRYDVALDLTRMNRIVEHNPADLVIVVEAGATLGAVQDALAHHGQWLPWDPPAPPHATIGGLLASAASGPLRLGYGTPRDWMLGMRAVLGDGRSVKSGSKVVKNVAGYDAHKLHLGALGTLGVIAEVTFKLAPLPSAKRSLLLTVDNVEAAFATMEALRSAPLAPISMIALNESMIRSVVPSLIDSLSSTKIIIAVRYAGVPAAVDRQLTTARERCADAAVLDLLENDEDQTLWSNLAQLTAGGAEGIVLRGGARPGSLVQLGEALTRPALRHGWQTPLALYGGVGLAYARWSLGTTDAPDVAAALAEARAALPSGGYVVVEDAPDDLRPNLDLWGPPPSAIGLMRTLRTQWNERDIINPGRGIV